MKGVAAIERERVSLGSHFEQYCVKYFDIAKRYCLNAEDMQKLVTAFQDKVKIDIVQLSQEMSPLGLKLPYIDSSAPSKNKLEQRDEEWYAKAQAAIEQASKQPE